MIPIAALAQAAPVDLGGAAGDAARRSAGIYTALLYALILVIGFAFVSYACLRLSRRYGQRLGHKPAAPTPTPDIWIMHKTPPHPTDRPDEEPDDEP